MTYLDELLTAKESLQAARTAVGNLYLQELYHVRISSPENMSHRQKVINTATYELIDALTLLAYDLDEEIKDASN